MRIIFYILVLPDYFVFSNKFKTKFKEDLGAKLGSPKARDTKVATMDQYRFISIERDTTYLDTALTIQRIQF
jgi:hypothetical protein